VTYDARLEIMNK